MLVSYVVSNASWTPRYDLRVSSSERTMQVTYFGMVQQNTGEDWCVRVRGCVVCVCVLGGACVLSEAC